MSTELTEEVLAAPSPKPKRRVRRKRTKKEEQMKLMDALKIISSRIGVLGVLLTFLTSFSVPGVLTTALTGSFELDETGTASLMQNIRLTAPLTVGLTIIFFILSKRWIENVLILYMIVGATLAGTSFLFSEQSRGVLYKAWEAADGNLLFSFPAALIKEYWRLYFWAPFVGSLITAIFLTWALHKLGKVKKLY